MGTICTPSGHSASTIVIGTPGYISAEQGAGRPVFSSDLYALGLTAIYLLTGQSPQHLQTNLQTGEIEWYHPSLNLDPHLLQILLKTTRYNPGDRYHNAPEMFKELSLIETLSPPNHTFPQINPQPSFPPSQPTETTINQTNLIPLSEIETSRLPDWQKALIIGTIIGIFSFLGIVLSRYFEFPFIFNPSQTETSPFANRISPEETVYNYYNYINQKQYEQGWKQLSIEHQTDTDRHPQGYQSYLEWWTSVESVQVVSVSLIRQSGNYALVETELHYEMKQGRPFDQKLNFHFIWDDSLQQWSINWVDRIYTKYL
jgi:serine/threonine protein kinase, bacterial